MQNVVSPGRRAKPKTISLREAASSEKDRRHGAEIIVLNPHKDGDTMASIFRRGDVANQSCSLPLVRVKPSKSRDISPGAHRYEKDRPQGAGNAGVRVVHVAAKWRRF